MQITGNLVAVGLIDGAGARGIQIETDGETVELTGMTPEEVRSAATHLGERITITIQPANTAISRPADGDG